MLGLWDFSDDSKLFGGVLFCLFYDVSYGYYLRFWDSRVLQGSPGYSRVHEGGIWETSGGIWETSGSHLEASRSIRGDIWRRLEASGEVPRRHQEAPGGTRGHQRRLREKCAKSYMCFSANVACSTIWHERGEGDPHGLRSLRTTFEGELWCGIRRAAPALTPDRQNTYGRELFGEL